MDIVTDNYNNISLAQLQAKLSQKFAELEKAEQTNALEKSSNKDYIEQTNDPRNPQNYDEQDFQRVLEKFKRTDAQIRSHEQVHATIGATTAPISYNYQQGPDGKMYAVGGSVRLDTSIPDDPKAAAFKLDQIQKAASGPVDTSGADNTIASQSNLNKILLELQGEDYASK
jgi:lysozyme family protein